MKKILFTALTFSSMALLTACVPTTANRVLDTVNAVATASTGSAAKTTTSLTTGSSTAVTYKNKTYGFSFTIPAGWKKQSGNPDSNQVLFVKAPTSDSCSFQFHINPMSKSFPAAVSVKASIKKAKQDIELGKLLLVKSRRDKDASGQGTLGWEVVEKGQKGGNQRIIYQLYDAKNRYYNLMAAATTEKFKACRPALRKIIDSIKFN
jgi:hypothetical protein